MRGRSASVVTARRPMPANLPLADLGVHRDATRTSHWEPLTLDSVLIHALLLGQKIASKQAMAAMAARLYNTVDLALMLHAIEGAAPNQIPIEMKNMMATARASDKMDIVHAWTPIRAGPVLAQRIKEGAVPEGKEHIAALYLDAVKVLGRMHIPNSSFIVRAPSRAGVVMDSPILVRTGGFNIGLAAVTRNFMIDQIPDAEFGVQALDSALVRPNREHCYPHSGDRVKRSVANTLKQAEFMKLLPAGMRVQFAHCARLLQDTSVKLLGGISSKVRHTLMTAAFRAMSFSYLHALDMAWRAIFVERAPSMIVTRLLGTYYLHVFHRIAKGGPGASERNPDVTQAHFDTAALLMRAGAEAFPGSSVHDSIIRALSSDANMNSTPREVDGLSSVLIRVFERAVAIIPAELASVMHREIKHLASENSAAGRMLARVMSSTESTIREVYEATPQEFVMHLFFGLNSVSDMGDLRGRMEALVNECIPMREDATAFGAHTPAQEAEQQKRAPAYARESRATEEDIMRAARRMDSLRHLQQVMNGTKVQPEPPMHFELPTRLMVVMYMTAVRTAVVSPTTTRADIALLTDCLAQMSHATSTKSFAAEHAAWIGESGALVRCIERFRQKELSGLLHATAPCANTHSELSEFAAQPAAVAVAQGVALAIASKIDLPVMDPAVRGIGVTARGQPIMYSAADVHTLWAAAVHQLPARLRELGAMEGYPLPGTSFSDVARSSATGLYNTRGRITMSKVPAHIQAPVDFIAHELAAHVGEALHSREVAVRLATLEDAMGTAYIEASTSALSMHVAATASGVTAVSRGAHGWSTTVTPSAASIVGELMVNLNVPLTLSADTAWAHASPPKATTQNRAMHVVAHHVRAAELHMKEVRSEVAAFVYREFIRHTNVMLMTVSSRWSAAMDESGMAVFQASLKDAGAHMHRGSMLHIRPVSGALVGGMKRVAYNGRSYWAGMVVKESTNTPSPFERPPVRVAAPVVASLQRAVPSTPPQTAVLASFVAIPPAKAPRRARMYAQRAPSDDEADGMLV